MAARISFALLVLFVLQATSALAAVFSCVGGTVFIIAHPDDDLLFQAPDLQTDVASGACITTVILTAGDSGTSGSSYVLSREQGNGAAYAQMTGVGNTWTEFTTSFGGQQVLVTTLVGAPQIQRVHFRLPDGNMDGSGFPSTGYQSLRNLYFGSISSIRNQPGTATFTLSTLKAALAEILTARQPSWVRTLDNLSDFDAGDHADHLASARIATDVASQFSNASTAGYMGYPAQNFAPTMGLDDGSFIAKCNAFFAYTPYDSAECQSLSECWSAGRGEVYWLLRQYIVSEDLAEQSYIGSAEMPVVLPEDLDNVAPLGQVFASSASGMTVTSVSPSTGSAGLAEFKAFGELCSGCTPGSSIDDGATTTTTSSGVVSGNGAYADLALSAHAFASSSFAQQGADRAVDGVISGYPLNSSAEWASYNERTPWINLTWDAYYMVAQVSLYDRPNLVDQITGAVLVFDDGSFVSTGALYNDGSATNISVPGIVTTSIKMRVTSVSPSTAACGLSEFAVYGS
ncbi:uncharacterized protein RHOBADRAFT_12165, partial [Rhodotorula graminis WP1]